MLNVMTVFLCALSMPIVHSHQLSNKPHVSFAFFGCNRIDAKDVAASLRSNPSTANVPQLKANLQQIQNLNPDFTFFGGDIVMGYADDDGSTLRLQLTAWNRLVSSIIDIPEMHMIAIAGNHELNRKAGEKKLPNPKTVDVWGRFLRDSKMIPKRIHAGPTPQHSFGDPIAANESRLTFSFDRDYVHFVVLNTDTRVTTIDPATGESLLGVIPGGWLEHDLQSAEKNPRTKAIVILGHRNLIDPKGAVGDAPIEAASAKRLMNAIRSHSKVRAYICAHVHAMEVTIMDGMNAVQALFGNGGSKLEAGWKPASGRSFGFGMFSINPDGKLAITPYERPEPGQYLADTIVDVPPAVAGPTVYVQPRTK